MQLIINRINNISDDWYKNLVQGVIDKIARSVQIKTAQEVAGEIAQAFYIGGREGYVQAVDTSKISPNSIKPSDQFEVWFYEPMYDENHAVVRVGVDAKNHIHIESSPRPRMARSIEIIEE